jgi:hypothetical protein
VTDPKTTYITSGKTLRQIAKELEGVPGCTLDALKHRSHREGWSAARRDYRAGIAETAKSISQDVGSSIAADVTKAYEQLLRTAILTNGEATKVLLAHRIKMRATHADDATEVELNGITLSDRLKAAQMHSIAANTIRSLFPRSTLEADAQSDGVSATDEEVLREMKVRFGAGRFYDDDEKLS